MISLAVLPGDGIGPEVVTQALRILDYLVENGHIKAQYKTALVGGAALDATGSPLPSETLKLCEESDAILFGSVGGPKWESLTPDLQPERGALLPLRKHFSLYANLRPILLPSEIGHLSPIRSRNLPTNLDILIVRELIGGIYFSKPKQLEKDYALDTLKYTRTQIERIAHLAFRIAQTRNKRLTSIDKANVLNSMVFWRKTVQEIALDYPDVALTHLYVDNAAMQLIVDPGQFDVMLCPNMFGDILSDEASVICGSLGMLPSASLSSQKTSLPDGTSSRDQSTDEAMGSFGLYEPAGGSAPDIAGKNIANPIAQIRSLALLLRHSGNRPDLADKIDTAITQALVAGYRTQDIYLQNSSDPHETNQAAENSHNTEQKTNSKETLVNTTEMATIILNNLSTL